VGEGEEGFCHRKEEVIDAVMKGEGELLPDSADVIDAVIGCDADTDAGTDACRLSDCEALPVRRILGAESVGGLRLGCGRVADWMGGGRCASSAPLAGDV
jgi:hypothetical protein